MILQVTYFLSSEAVKLVEHFDDGHSDVYQRKME